MTKAMQAEMERLGKDLLTLSALVEESVAKAVLALENRDEKLAHEIISKDYLVDLKEVEVEEECLRVLALHQPVASDLRLIIAALKINNDLERIADLAVNMAERALFLCQHPEVAAPFDLKTMASKTRNMLRQALSSFVGRDVKLAHEVRKMDNEVDQIHRGMYDKVFNAIRANPDHVEVMAQFLSASRHLERIADYATNIAEDVIYMIEGKIIRHNPDTDKK
jgi:phosphate transport system protein